MYKHHARIVARRSNPPKSERSICLLLWSGNKPAIIRKSLTAYAKRLSPSRVDGVLNECRESRPSIREKNHTIEVVVDRLVVRPNFGERLMESLHATLKQGGGRVIITDIDDGDWHDQPYNTVLECPAC